MIDNSAMKKEGKADLVQDQPDVTEREDTVGSSGSSAGGREDHVLSDMTGSGSGHGGESVNRELFNVATAATPADPEAEAFAELEAELAAATVDKNLKKHEGGNTRDLLDVAAGAPSAAADANPPVTDGHIPGSTMDGTVAVPGSGEPGDITGYGDDSADVAAGMEVKGVADDAAHVTEGMEVKGVADDVAHVTEGMEVKGVTDDVAQPADELAAGNTYSEAATVILDSPPVAGGREELDSPPVASGREEAKSDDEAVEADGADSSLQDIIESLNQEIVALRKKSEDYREAALQVRTEAEAEKQRMQREMEKVRSFALEKSIQELLPVLDSLEFGVQAASGSNADMAALCEGMTLTLELFTRFMQSAGAEEINPIGEKFDPEIHEAVSVQSVAGATQDHVITVVQKGYTLNGRLLRPAKVIVSG